MRSTSSSKTLARSSHWTFPRLDWLVFAALPVAGSKTADYTVRNLVEIDPTSGVIAIGEAVPEGGKDLFFRRDRETAVLDMRRMAEDVKRLVGDRVIRGGVYVSCAARGPNQFAPPENETEITRDTLGTFPMVGFFANGELNRDRIYANFGGPHPGSSSSTIAFAAASLAEGSASTRLESVSVYDGNMYSEALH